MESLEKTVINHLIRWLGLPKSLSSITLCRSNNKLPSCTLPISGLCKEFKVSHTREVLQYTGGSGNPKVSQAGIKVMAGRKWRAQETLDQVEARLYHKKVVGYVAIGRVGLDQIPTKGTVMQKRRKGMT